MTMTTPNHAEVEKDEREKKRREGRFIYINKKKRRKKQHNIPIFRFFISCVLFFL